jgi:hypothetical protein
MPITVAARSKAWTIFAHSNAGIMCSNPTWVMDVCVRLFSVYGVLCVSPVLKFKKLKNGHGPNKGV